MLVEGSGIDGVHRILDVDGGYCFVDAGVGFHFPKPPSGLFYSSKRREPKRRPCRRCHYYVSLAWLYVVLADFCFPLSNEQVTN